LRSRHACAAYIFTIAVMLLLPFGAARADTLNGTGGAWQSGWTQTQLVQGASPTPGTPYWNNLSGDGNQGNIGWCLTGGGATCVMAGSPGVPLPYYGTATAGSVGSMSFTSSGSSLNLSLAGIFTNETTAVQYDIFGYYVVPASGSPTLVPLFSTRPGAAQATVGSTATLNLSAGTNYGFYVENVQGGGSAESDFFFYMNSALNDNTFNNGTPMAGPDADQHFAIFQSSNGYVIGDVDAFACASPSQQGSTPCIMPNQFDYNDLVVTVSPASTPEPASLGLIGVGVILGAGLLRRKLRNLDQPIE